MIARPLLMLLSLLVFSPAAMGADQDQESQEEGETGRDRSKEQETLEESVLVTATRTARALAQSAVPATVITREQIEESGARTIADLLRYRSGVRIESSFRGDTLSLQGLGSEYVLVLVDGERLPGRTDGAIDLDRITLQSVERVEVVQGPASALHGADALAGVINIVTREVPEAPLQSELSATYGGRHTLDLAGSVAGRWKNLSGRISGGWRRGDAYSLDPDSETTHGSAFQHFDLRGLLVLTPVERFRLEFRTNWRRGDDRSVDVSATGATSDRRKLIEEHGISIRPVLTWGSQNRIAARVGYLRFHDQYLVDQRGTDSGDSFQRTIDDQLNAEVQWDQALGDRMVVTSGVDFFLDRLQSDRITEDGLRARLGLFVQDEITVLQGVGPRLVITPGVRVDIDSSYGTAPTPKLAVRFDPHPAIGLRVNGGLGYRAPSFKELLLLFENSSRGYAVQGNPDLKPERSFGLGGGLMLRPTPFLTITVDGYRNDLQDMITIETLPSDDTGTLLLGYVNVGRATTQGVQASILVRPLAFLQIRGGYEFTHTRDHATDLPLEGRPEHRGTAAVELLQVPWGLIASIRGEFVGPRPFYLLDELGQAAETEPSNPYALLNIRVAKRFGRHIEIFVGVENLLLIDDGKKAHFVDLSNADIAGPFTHFPSTPWRAYGGINLRY